MIWLSKRIFYSQIYYECMYLRNTEAKKKILFLDIITYVHRNTWYWCTKSFMKVVKYCGVHGHYSISLMKLM